MSGPVNTVKLMEIIGDNPQIGQYLIQIGQGLDGIIDTAKKDGLGHQRNPGFPKAAQGPLNSGVDLVSMVDMNHDKTHAWGTFEYV